MLINGIVKIISKVLASNLKGATYNIISSYQRAFLYERFILDSFVTARQTINHCKSQKAEGTLLQLDLKRPLVIGIFCSPYSKNSTSLAQLDQGWLSQFQKISLYFLNNCVTHHHDLPLGDLLSPYLFLLDGDVLSFFFHKAQEVGVITSLSPGPATTKQHCLQFIDDMLIFCEEIVW